LNIKHGTLPSVAAAAGVLLTLAGIATQADELTARQIVERAHEAAGGAAWLDAGTNVMRGDATLCRDGDPARCSASTRPRLPCARQDGRRRRDFINACTRISTASVSRSRTRSSCWDRV
jgi:hypothetical protein